MAVDNNNIYLIYHYNFEYVRMYGKIKLKDPMKL